MPSSGMAAAAMDVDAMVDKVVCSACVCARDDAFEGCRRVLQGLVHTVPERPIGTTWSGKALHTQFWPNVLEFS